MRNGFLFLPVWVMFFLLLSSNASSQSPCFFSSGSPTNLIKICSDNGWGIPNEPGGCPDGSTQVSLDVNCEGRVSIRFYFANLVGSGPTYQLPAGYPPVYIRHEYTEGNWQISGPYTDFLYGGLVDDINFGKSPIYYLSDSLLTARTSNTGCFESEELPIETFYMGIELVTPNPRGGFSFYPIGDYAAPGEAFDCGIFEETYPLCLNPDGTVQDPSYEINVCIDCGTCRNIPDPVDITDPRSTAVENTGLEAVQILPKPCQESVELLCTTYVDVPVSWAIYDARGAFVQSQRQDLPAGEHNQRIATEQLPTGIYYLQLRGANERVSQKIIKTP